MSQEGDEQRLINRIALAMVTMRVDTPEGQWVEDTFGDAYFRLWDDAREGGGEDYEEFLFLGVLNLASAWLQQLADVSGRPVSDWLDDVRRDIDSSRAGDEDQGGEEA